MTTIKWTRAAFASLDTPASYPSNTREDPAAAGVSAVLYAWDEAKRIRALKREQAAEAKRRVGVRSFTWEVSDAGQAEAGQ